MSRPCEHRHPDPEKTAATCRICHLALTDPAYQRKFGMPATAPAVVAFRPNRSKPCAHLGERVNVAGSVRNWHVCKKGHGTVCPCGACKTCGDYEASNDEDGPRRHLLYHLLPVAGNGCWQRNLDQLKWRMGLFTGRKVIAVCTAGRFTDTNTNRGTFNVDPPEAVAEYMAGTGCEIITLPNDPKLREVVTWRPLWERLQEFADTDDPIFYAQGKGVTQPWNPGVTVHPWTRVMYSSLLDFWPVVEAELIRWPIAGSFKKVGRGFTGSASRWHYSGSFFWIRAREAFKHGRWLNIDNVWWGNEAWPGLHFPPEHAGVVFKQGTVPALDNYSPPKFFGGILPEFRDWCHANAHRRTREVAHA